jgi:hypothetical protein
VRISGTDPRRYAIIEESGIIEGFCTIPDAAVHLRV